VRYCAPFHTRRSKSDRNVFCRGWKFDFHRDCRGDHQHGSLVRCDRYVGRDDRYYCHYGYDGHYDGRGDYSSRSNSSWNNSSRDDFY
jgi:hypothetical protein